ncbi:hypothetical protein [Shinella sp.]|jgi:hypothetical protein|uniref:hypothetical protein n=1 Tax=Shinella sp. TaxID=1870904 RepID=UPI003F70A9A5
MDYQRIILSGPVIDGAPGLPAALLGLTDASLADLSAVLNPCPAEYAGIGYWPIQPAEPTPIYKVAVSRAPAFVEGTLMWVEVLEDAPPPPLTPISPRQMLIGLLSIGITEAMVLAELETIADPQERAIALIEWHKATMIERDHPLVDDLAATFDLPPVQVDTLWRWAASL